MANPDTEPNGLTRRQFIGIGSAVLGAAAFVPSLLSPSRATAAAAMVERELVGPQSQFNPVVCVNPGEQNYWHEIYDSTLRKDLPIEITGTLTFRPDPRTPQNNLTGIAINNGRPVGSLEENSLIFYRMPDGSVAVLHRHGGQTDRPIPIGTTPSNSLEDFTIAIADNGQDVKVTSPVGVVDNIHLNESLFSSDRNLRLMAITNGYAKTEISRLSVSQPPMEGDIFPSGEALRVLGQRRGLSIGTTAPTRRGERRPQSDPQYDPRYDPRYERILAKQFGHVVIDSDINGETSQPAEGVFDFARADQVVNFAVRNGMEVYGQHLTWGQFLPRWFAERDPSPAETEKFMNNRIIGVTGHFGNIIPQWVGANEVIADNGEFRQNIWYKKLGRGYPKMAFQAARNAAPGSLLIYNEDKIELPSRKTESVLKLAQELKVAGLIDAIGTQTHLKLSEISSIDAMVRDMRTVMQQVLNLGLLWIPTELDVDGAPNPDEEKQADILNEVLGLALEAGSPRLTFWGFEDSISWLLPQGMSPHLYTYYRPKVVVSRFQNTLIASK